jgi:hypothetical protein
MIAIRYPVEAMPGSQGTQLFTLFDLLLYRRNICRGI